MKNPSIKTLKRKLWDLCRQITAKRYPNSKCYTCDRVMVGPDKQLAHLIPSGACGAFLRWDLRNLRFCCWNCNINLGGNGAEFYRRMVKEVGQKEVDKLFKDKQKLVKADILWFKEKIKDYEKIFEETN